MHRKEYWNKNYVKYWKKRVEEANSNNKNSNLVEGDSLTSPNQQYIKAIEFLSPKKNKSILEMGCGFGRSLPYLYDISKLITAIDISKEMIQEAKKKNSNLDGIKYFVSEAEKTPINSSSFSYIICFAVFDALYQNSALLEMNRLLEKDGKVLISGKNDNYHDDDDLAYKAEVNARKKKHPNFFTDINFLLSGAINKFGFEIEKIKYFERRGDAVKDKHMTELPKFFYEYIMIIKKIKNIKQLNIKISNKYSKTFKRRK
jgi:SAM-dependent methyltransferase